MNAQIITTENELFAVKDRWNEMVQNNPETDSPFLSFEWFINLWTYFGKPAGQKLFVVAVYDNSELVGILPLTLKRCTSVKFPYRSLGFCLTGIMPRNTIYTDPERNQTEIFHTAWDFLFANRSAWDVLELRGVPNETAFHRFVLDEPHHTKDALIQNQGNKSPFVQLTGLTYEEYFSKYGHKDTRRRVKRNTEKYEQEKKHWRMEIYEKEENIQQGIDLSLEVRANSWKGEFKNPNYVHFYRTMFSEFAAQQRVLIAILMLDDVPTAAQYIIGSGSKYYLLTNDFDMRCRETAPGKCLLHFMLIEAFNRHWELFDFTGSDYDYKKDFQTGKRSHSVFQIFHTGWKSRFIYWAKTSLLPLWRKILRKPAPGDLIMHRKAF